MATREERERQDARVAKFWRDKEATLYGADCYCDERIGDCDACKAVASRKVDKVPDRVIDAPIWEKRKELSARLYEEWCQLSIYERGKFTDYVFDYCVRLEAEKQDARTSAMEEAARMLEDHASLTDNREMDCAADMVRRLPKPTASANRAEGRHG